MNMLVPIETLKPHPKNKELFPDPPQENLWREIVADVKENGIINPLIVAKDYTVIAGHLRLEAAKEAGLTHVLVDKRDLLSESDWAVSLMIRDNLLRRHLNEMQVARLIRVLKEQYGVKHGGYREPNMENVDGSKGQNVLLKVADVVGMTKKQIQRYDKLNDLIPELQELVSSGKLGSTAAYELAFLSPDTQRQLLSVYGEKLSALKQSEAKELRRKIEEEIRAEAEKQVNELRQKIDALDRQKKELQVLHEERETDLRRAIADLQEKLRESVSPEKAAYLQDELQKKEQELADAQRKLTAAEISYRAEISGLKKKIKDMEAKKLPQPEVIEKIVEKIVEVPDPKQQARIKELEEQIAALQKELADLKNDDSGIEVKKALLREIKELEAERDMLDRELNRKRSTVNFTLAIRKVMHQLEASEAEIAILATQVDLSGTHRIEAQKWISILGRYQEHIRTALGIADKSKTVVPFKRKEG